MNGGWSMKLDYYQVEAHRTALYKNLNLEIAYPCLGLIGELAELVEAIEAPQFDTERIYSELGDVLWYIAAVCTDMGLQLSVCTGVESFEEITLNNPGSDIKFFLMAGRAWEAAKKVLRDGNETKKVIIRACLRNLLEHFSAFCNFNNLSLTHAADLNLNKLRSRQERGVVHGDGDTR